MPVDHRPPSAVVWGGTGLAAAIAATVLLALGGGSASWRSALRPAGAALAVTLALTLLTGWATWRTIVGSPANQPSDFYAADHIGPIVDDLVAHAGDRPILGLYLSNHYECSIVTPLAGGPAGSRGGEIFSINPDRSTSSVQTALSEGLASGDGVPVDELDLGVIPLIAEQVRDDQGIGARDEIRIQLQTRGGVTEYGVLTRIDGQDQPWVYFDTDGHRLH